MRIPIARAALCTLALLAGCASAPSLPPCAAISITVLSTRAGHLYAFDAAQIEALANMIQQIQDGKCRISGEEKDA